jgi:hypothetical protein
VGFDSAFSICRSEVLENGAPEFFLVQDLSDGAVRNPEDRRRFVRRQSPFERQEGGSLLRDESFSNRGVRRS